MGTTYRGKAMRLAKYLAHAGVASRRAAEELIRAGRVAVDGEVAGDRGRQLLGGGGGPGAPAPRGRGGWGRWRAGRRAGGARRVAGAQAGRGGVDLARHARA